MTTASVRRIVRASAVYDLIVTAAFALPVTAPALFDGLGAAHRALGLTGSVPDSGDAYVVMFANLMGSLVVVWATFRILRPTRAAGAADSAARVLFSVGMLAALVSGASPLILVMLVPEIAWALVQGVAVGARRPSVVGSVRAHR